MTEEPRITNTQKEKDPRKAAAGKKLGAISKMAKNQKQRCEAEASRVANEDASDFVDTSWNLKNNNAFFYVGFAAVVVVGYLGIQYFTKKSQDAPDAPNAPVVPVDPKFQQTSLTHRGSNLISLDD